MFSYTFIARAVFAGFRASLCAALLGVSLVLRRSSMTADALSRIGFGALALFSALHALVPAAAVLLLRPSESRKIKGAAAKAAPYFFSPGEGALKKAHTLIPPQSGGVCTPSARIKGTAALAATGFLVGGVVIISQTTGLNRSLFGGILAVSRNDAVLSVAAAVLSLWVFFYHKIFALTFDETYARAVGSRVGLCTPLISALTVFPALTAMEVCKTFKAAVLSILCFFTGLVISSVYTAPAGAGVVLVTVAAFAVFSAVEALKRPLPIAAKGAAAVCMVLALGACTGKTAAGAVNISDTSGVSAETSAPKVAAPAIKTIAPWASGEVEIREKMFIAQVSDIYLNAEDYLGKTIKLQGLWKMENYSGVNRCFVLRYGPGCCGSDGNAGFEVDPDTVGVETSAAEDDWVEVAGTLKTYEEEGFPFLYLALSSLRVLDERGAEFVTQ